MAISDNLSLHSQVLLLMGREDGIGRLKPNEDGLMTASWVPKPNNDNYYELLHERFSEMNKSDLDGGQYHQNSIWQFLPDDFEEIIEETKYNEKQVLTVHPLGGCVMGNDQHDGVVDINGNVFNCNSDQISEIYEGLFVLDGSIIPGPIGVNPFLTIATLAYVLSTRIVDPKTSKIQAFPELSKFKELPKFKIDYESQIYNQKAEAIFTERLTTIFFSEDFRVGPKTKQINEIFDFTNEHEIPHQAKELVCDIRFDFSDTGSLDKWLKNPSQELPAQLDLSYSNNRSVHTIVDDELIKVTTLNGYVKLEKVEAIGKSFFLIRSVSAIIRYIIYRFNGFNILKILQHSLLSPSLLINKKPLKKLKSIWRIAKLHANWRYLIYDFKSQTEGGDLITFKGKKSIRFTPLSRDLWNSITTLPAILSRRSSENTSLKLELKIDPIRITENSPIQAVNTCNSSNSIFSNLGFGAFFTRMLLETHFWSFGAPDYDNYKEKDEQVSEKKSGRLELSPKYIHFGTRSRYSSLPKETYFCEDGSCRLIRYQPSNADIDSSKAILLIHGLAHSSRIFWSDTLSVNYTQYFLSQNYDVWILDHSTSANIHADVNPEITWDKIGLVDIPWSVRFIYRIINKEKPYNKKIHVFAHCIGAGAFCMATLAGKSNHLNEDTQKSESMIASYVSHAVTPWFLGSLVNRSRMNVWRWFKDLGLIKTVETALYKKPSRIEIIYDRLAYSFLNSMERKSWPLLKSLIDDRGPGFARNIYNRYKLFWGPQWNHYNISNTTKSEFSGMIGAVPTKVIQQIYFSMKYGQLISFNGDDSYVNSAAFRDHWTFPTYFIHGNKNEVFDVESSKLTAHLLTDLRKFENRTLNPNVINLDNVNPPKIEDYLNNGINIDVVENYGHMDIIIGKNAYQDICPLLDSFFSASSEYKLDPKYIKESTVKKHDSVRSNQISRQSFSNSIGPIISVNCSTQKNQRAIRIWFESGQSEEAYPRLLICI